MGKKRKPRKQVRKTKTGNTILVLGGLLLLGIAYFVLSNQAAVIEPGDGVLATPITVHNFGIVPVKQGVVSVEVPLVNIGEDNLVISFLDSSCGCTSARVINDGVPGPVFGMSSHGKSPQDWQATITTGKQASLKIYYDPSVHPAFRGPATRVITITSNGKSTPQKQIRIKVNQID
jgi:hypothetical protein